MRRTTRRGFALPLTLFLISLLTLMLTAAFTKVQSDRRVAEYSGDNVDALTIARAALQSYLGTAASRPADGDSTRINVTGGYGDVIARVIRRPSDTLANWTFIVRSVGHVIVPTQGADPAATRTVAQFAQWQTGQIDVRGALTAADGLQKNAAGQAVTINGVDSASCGASTTAGIHTRTGGDPGLSGAQYSVAGSPAVADSVSSSSVITLTNIDWSTITGGGFAADYTSYQSGDATYSSQLLTGNNTISGLNGTGLLIVTGDLTLTGSTATWKGIIIAGGKINFNACGLFIFGTCWSGGSTIQGMVIEGLNNAGTKADVATRPLTIQYNSCRIRQTMARLTGFAPITNGWVDNWATY